MIILQHTPHPALRSMIDFFYLMHIQQEKGSPPVVSPFPPTPLQFIVFYLDDQVVTNKEGETVQKTRSRCMVVGPQATKMNVIVHESHRCFVIGFQPGGLHRFLRIPMTELYDDGFDGRQLMGKQMETLTAQLMEAPDFNQMVVIAEKYFLNCINMVKEQLPIDLAMAVLANQKGLVAIDKVASLACLSVRQFERKCLERIGYSPKFYARLARFSKAYRLRKAMPHLSWTAIAYEAGYFDQAHLIRDFRQFTGISPRILDKQINNNPFPMQGFLENL